MVLLLLEGVSLVLSLFVFHVVSIPHNSDNVVVHLEIMWARIRQAVFSRPRCPASRMSWANLITRSRYPLGRTICSKVVPGDSLGVQIRQTRPCIRLILVGSSCCIHLCMSGSFSCSDFICMLLLMSFIWSHCKLCSLLSALVLRVFGFDWPNTSSLNGNPLVLTLSPLHCCLHPASTHFQLLFIVVLHPVSAHFQSPLHCCLHPVFAHFQSPLHCCLHPVSCCCFFDPISSFGLRSLLLVQCPPVCICC